MQPGDEMLTSNEMSSWVRLSEDRLRKMARAGIGPPAIKVGANSWRWRRSDVEAWLDEQRNTSPAA